MSDLRSFLEVVREQLPEQIVDVRRPVSPTHETTAIVTRFEQSYRSPVLFFHEVTGSAYPVVTNVCGSMRRLALAMDCPMTELRKRYAEGCSRPIRPTVVTSASVQERVFRADDVDLGVLPQLIYHENDAELPYITAAIVAARDPESGRTNLSYHRLMITGRNTTGIYIAVGKHLDAIHRKYEASGHDMPIAAFIGAHPIWSLGAVFTGPAEVEEYDIIGGLQGRPIELVQCVSQDALCVPAHAEIVLEGRVVVKQRITEGPFGEFTGFSTGTMQTPVFHVDAMTTRNDPIFQDIASGHTEHLILPVLGMEHHLLEVARAAVPGVTDVRIPVPLMAAVSIDKTDDDQPRRVIEALMECDIYTKQVVVVDAGTDLADPRQILTAMALQVQADRSVFVFADQKGTPLDPSCPADGRTAKMGIDATTSAKATRMIRRNAVAQDLLETIDLSEFLTSSQVTD